VENNLRKGQYANRIGQTASVYLAAVLEYLVGFRFVVVVVVQNEFI